MKVIAPAQTYEFETPAGKTARLEFYRKNVCDGLTNEQVLAALLDRLRHQNGLGANRETAQAITKLEEAQMWLDAYYRRTAVPASTPAPRHWSPPAPTA